MLETLRERALELLDQAAPERARHVAHYLELAERSEQALKGPEQVGLGRAGRARARQPARRARPRRARDRAADRGRAGLLLVHARPQRRGRRPPRTHAGRGRRPRRRRCCAGERCRRSGFSAPSAATSAPRRRSSEAWRCSAPRATARARPSRSTRSAPWPAIVATPPAARVAFEEAIDAYRSLEDRHRLADSLCQPGGRGDRPGPARRGRALFAESIALDRAFDNHWGIAQNLSGQATLALARGEPDQAAALLADAVQSLRRLGDRLSLVAALERLAATAAAREDHAFAARLWGAAGAQRDAAGEPRTAAEAAALGPLPRRLPRRPRPRGVRVRRKRGRRARPRCRAHRSAAQSSDLTGPCGKPACPTGLRHLCAIWVVCRPRVC